MTAPETQAERCARLEARVAELEHAQAAAQGDLTALEQALHPLVARSSLAEVLALSVPLLACKRAAGMPARITGPTFKRGPWVPRLVGGEP